MKIAIYTHSIAPSIDGVCRRFTSILYELISQGHEVLLFTLEDKPQDIPLNINFISLAFTTYSIYPGKKVAFPTFSNLFKIYMGLRQFQPDIVHITSDAMSTLFALCCLYLCLPLVASIHTDLFDLVSTLFDKPRDYLFRMMILILLAQKESFDALVVDSVATTSQSFSQKLKQLSINCDFILKTAVDTKVFTPNKCDPNFRNLFMWKDNSDIQLIDNSNKYQALPQLQDKNVKLLSETKALNKIKPNTSASTALSTQPPEEILLCFTGRLSREKQIDVLIEGIKDLPNVYLAIVGDGPASEYYSSFHSKENRIYCRPKFLTHEELAAVYSSSDIHVSASEFETLGNTVLEAFACGIPVIVPLTQGFRDTVTDGVNGYLFQPKNIQDFQKYVLLMQSDSKLRKQFGQNGLETVKKLGITDVVHSILAWYQLGIKNHKIKINNLFIVLRNFFMLTIYVPFSICFHLIHSLLSYIF